MRTLILAFAVLATACAQAEPVRLDVPPSATAREITAANSPHIVLFDSANRTDKLLLWMPGTLGTPRLSPQLNFPQFAAQQGYRVILLSYITDQAVSTVCAGMKLRDNRSCAEDFRRKRVFGNPGFSLIADQPHDAINYRFTKLLQHLKDTRKDENWGQFLTEDGNPRWERIAVAGQSQGGGHAAFIAKSRPVARVVTLSGGWDKSARGQIADWYAKPSLTPPERWFFAYHVDEAAASTMAEIGKALNVPVAHVGAFDKPVAGAMAHGEALSNTAYSGWWKLALEK